MLCLVLYAPLTRWGMLMLRCRALLGDGGTSSKIVLQVSTRVPFCIAMYPPEH